MHFVPRRMKWIVGEQVGMKRKKKWEGKEVPYWHERMNERGKKTLCVTEVTSCKNRQQ